MSINIHLNSLTVSENFSRNNRCETIIEILWQNKNYFNQYYL